MVFLFISFLVTIVLLIAPIPVGLNVFYDKIAEKPLFSYKIFGIIKYFPEKEKSTEKNPGKKKKKNAFGLSLKRPLRIDPFKKLITDCFLLELIIPPSLDPSIAFPMKGLFAAFNEYAAAKGYGSFIGITAACGDKAYFQARIYLRVSLFMIFSIFFQIIRIEHRR